MDVIVHADSGLGPLFIGRVHWSGSLGCTGKGRVGSCDWPRPGDRERSRAKPTIEPASDGALRFFIMITRGTAERPRLSSVSMSRGGPPQPTHRGRVFRRSLRPAGVFPVFAASPAGGLCHEASIPDLHHLRSFFKIGFVHFPVGVDSIIVIKNLFALKSVLQLVPNTLKAPDNFSCQRGLGL